MLTGESEDWSTLFNFFLCSLPSSSVKDQITVPISCGIRCFLPIVSTTLEIMGSILPVIMYQSGHFWALAELSTMTYYPSESNTTRSEYSNLEESIWHILSSEIVQKKKGLFFGVAFRRPLSLLTTRITWILILLSGSTFFFLQSQLLAPLANWCWLWFSQIAYVKINRQILGWLLRQKRDEYRRHLESSSLFFK